MQWNDSYTEKLPDKYVTSIAEDKAGNLWVGTHGGLARFSPSQSDVAIWKTASGLPSDRINSIYIDKDGSLWIGTDLGASHFDGSVFSNIRTSDFAKNFLRFKRLVK